MEQEIGRVLEFRSIKTPRSLCEGVIREIKRAILCGRYPNGAPLPSEAALARQFGVSRPVIREALRSLQSGGFVVIRRGVKGGAFVRDVIQPPLLDDFPSLILYRRLQVDHLAQARLFLEPEVCRLAALKASAVHVQGMKELVARYGAIADPDEKDRHYSLFHRLVGRACGNPLYAILIESIMDFTEGFIRTIKPVSTLIHQDHDHDEIIAAIERRDPETAAEVATRHASYILEEMRKLERTYLELLAHEDLDRPAGG